MCQAAVERILGKLVTDETFRARFYRDPAAASFSAGLDLSKSELDAVSRLSVEAITEFSACLYDRICHLPLDEEVRPIRQGKHWVRRGCTHDRAGRISRSAQETKEDEP